MDGSFTLAYVPGTTPAKWARMWEERLPDVPLHLVQVTAAEATQQIRDEKVDAALLRSPFDRDGLHAIPLYTETTGVVLPKDHELAAAAELSVEDIADLVVWRPLDDTLVWETLPGQPAHERPETTKDAIEIVAAGVGVLVVPQSLARLHHRKDLKFVPLAADGTDDVPQSAVALSWLIRDENPELVEHMIGIVRGRSVNSSRGPEPKKPVQKKPPRKPQQQQRRGSAGKQPGKRPKPRRGR